MSRQRTCCERASVHPVWYISEGTSFITKTAVQGSHMWNTSGCLLTSGALWEIYTVHKVHLENFSLTWFLYILLVDQLPIQSVVLCCTLAHLRCTVKTQPTNIKSFIKSLITALHFQWCCLFFSTLNLITFKENQLLNLIKLN